MNEYENEQNINRREGANSSAVETPCFNPRGFRTAAFRVYSAHLHTSGLGGCHLPPWPKFWLHMVLATH